MRTYCPQSFSRLASLGASKGSYLEKFEETFDYALPQSWLDDFAAYCDKHGLLQLTTGGEAYDNIAYDVILCTTVWSYGDVNDNWQGPVTFCTEVEKAFKIWERNSH